MLDWWLPENVSTYGRDIDWLFHLIYAITGVTFILVTVALVAFLIMYRDRPGRRARYTHGNTTLEIVWTIVPALILVVLTALSAPAWSRIKMSQPPSDLQLGRLLGGMQIRPLFSKSGVDTIDHRLNAHISFVVALILNRRLRCLTWQKIDANGEQPGSEVTFAESMRKRGHDKTKRNIGQVYVGLMLAGTDEESP